MDNVSKVVGGSGSAGDDAGGLSLLGCLLGGKRVGMGTFFSSADLAHIEGGCILVGWLLGN